MATTPTTSPCVRRKAAVGSSPTAELSSSSFEDSDEADELQYSNLSLGSSGFSSDQSPDQTARHRKVKSPGKTETVGLQRKPISDRSSAHVSSSKSPVKSSEKTTGSPHSVPSIYPSLAGLSPESPYQDLRNKLSYRSPPSNVAPGKPKSPLKAPKQEIDNVKCPTSLFLGTAVILAIILAIIFTITGIRVIFKNKPETITGPSKDVHTKFVDELNGLRAKFPAQDHRLWQTMSAATKRIINDTRPIQPAVLLMGSSESAREEADCLARHLSRVVTTAYSARQPISIDVPVIYSHLTPETAKIVLEETLNSGFRAGAKSAVITGLEALHGETAMLLHAFCDNDNAPFTKVVILFTVHISGLELTGSRQDARKVEDGISAIWQRNVNYDDVNALLSRVANNIVIVKKESDAVIKEHC